MRYEKDSETLLAMASDAYTKDDFVHDVNVPRFCAAVCSTSAARLDALAAVLMNDASILGIFPSLSAAAGFAAAFVGAADDAAVVSVATGCFGGKVDLIAGAAVDLDDTAATVPVVACPDFARRADTAFSNTLPVSAGVVSIILGGG